MSAEIEGRTPRQPELASGGHAARFCAGADRGSRLRPVRGLPL